MIRRILGLAILCVVTLVDARAAIGSNRIRLDTLDVFRGLPANSVRAVLTDHDGFVWVGTQDGLARFDGEQFEIWRHRSDDPRSIAESQIVSIAEDDSGQLFVAHPSAGISVLDRSRHLVSHWRASSHNLVSDRVQSVVRAGDGKLWVLFQNGRVQWLDLARARAVNLAEIDPHDLGAVRALAPGPAGGLWLASETGLWRLEVGRPRLERESRLGPVTTTQTRVLLEDGSGTLWVGAGDGLWRLARDGVSKVHLPFATPEDADRPEVESLLLDQKSRLWIGTRRGAFIYDRARMTVVERLDHDPADRQSLGSSRVTTLAQGADGVIWIGTWIGGLSTHDPRAASLRTLRRQRDESHSLPADPVVAIEPAGDGSLWLAMGESAGLVQVDPLVGVLERHVYRSESDTGLSSDYLLSLARDHDGRLWIGTGDRGLDRLDPATGDIERFGSAGSGFPGTTVRALLVTRAGDLVVGTLGEGLIERCSGCPNFVQHQPGAGVGRLLDTRITALAESDAGRLWVGTRGSGLMLRERGDTAFQPVPLDMPEGAKLNISDLAQGADGMLWIATYGEGVIRVEPRVDVVTPWQARRFDSVRGLSADHASALSFDSNGDLWVATARGLDRIHTGDLGISGFGLRAGTLASGYFLGAMARTESGEIAAGGMEGLSLLDPRLIADPGAAPRPKLTRFAIFNERLLPVPGSSLRFDADQVALLELGHRDAMLGIGFTAPSFGASETPALAYRLDGYDQNWIHAAPGQRVATYTRLPAGDYTFRVRVLRDADPGDAPAAATDATARIHVAPAPWATRLAFAGYLLAALLLIAIGVARWRARQRERAAAERVLVEKERRLHAALWGSGAELWELDLATQRISRENRLNGLKINDSQGEIDLRAYLPYVHPEEQPVVAAAVKRMVSGESGTFSMAYRTESRDGDWVWLLSRGQAVESDAEGRATRFVGTTQDISELKRSEDALRKMAEELEARVERRTAALSEANNHLQTSLTRIQDMQKQLVEAEKMASLGALVAGVAHEINTPIGVAVTAASFLREEARKLQRAHRDKTMTASMLEQFESQIMQGSEMILANLERGIQIVRSFKQVAVDTASEAAREIDLAEYFDEILLALHPRLRKTGHHVDVQVTEPIRINTYPVAIYQIVTNLVLNSLIHGFESIEAGTISIAARRDGTDIEIDYRDNGRGMSADVRERVFQPFFTTKRGQGGSGLGMHIVFNLVTQLLRGTIHCESAPDAGARFVIRFPAVIELPEPIR
jgi:signal transduction histidine kinase/ligand-binding sensor domain-containing protein